MKILRSKLLSKFKNVEHGFVSNVHNLSIQKISSLTAFQEIKTIDQVHSNQIVHFKDSSQFSQEFEGDALVTSVKGFGVGINTADCVPILIYDYNNQVVASVHAGWRGTYSRIVIDTLKLMKKELGTSANKAIAVIGPCIRKCCYEVDDEVVQKFSKRFKDSKKYLFSTDDDKFFLDLSLANYFQLKERDIEAIDIIATCTSCNDNFPSFRRQGEEAGRILSFIGLKDN